MSKVAVLLCSHVKTWNQCLPSFLKFMRGTNYDIFIHTYSLEKYPYIREQCKVKLNVPYKKLVVEEDTRSERYVPCSKNLQSKHILSIESFNCVMN